MYKNIGGVAAGFSYTLASSDVTLYILVMLGAGTGTEGTIRSVTGFWMGKLSGNELYI